MRKNSIASLCCSALVGIAHAAPAVDLSIVPDCPGPSVPVSVLAYQQVPPPVFIPTNPLVIRTGNSFKVVLDASSVVFSVGQSSSKTIALGLLAVGAYHVDLYYRYAISGGFGQEQFSGSLDFGVQENGVQGSTPCTPAALAVVRGAFQSTPVNSPFPNSIEVLVTDGQLRPVPNASIEFERVARPEDHFSESNQQPQAVLDLTRTSTDTNGIARVNATANGLTGTYQYVARSVRGNYVLSTYIVLNNRSEVSIGGPTLVPIVEYYYLGRDHYFMTADVGEMSLLDHGMLAGWQRTGGVFLGFAAGETSSPTGTSPVCRYYGRPEAGLDSHFFSASPSECQAVQGNFSQSWILETPDAFRQFLPDLVTGACGQGTVPLHRAYNNRADANHRYSLSQLVIAEMKLHGWVAEGYGPSAVVMCVPQ